MDNVLTQTLPNEDKRGGVMLGGGGPGPFIPVSQKGAANGVAELDSEQHLVLSEIPPSVASGTTVSAGDNGLVWNGAAWVSAQLETSEFLFYPEAYGAGESEDDTEALQKCVDAARVHLKARIILGPSYKIKSAPTVAKGGFACVHLPGHGEAETELAIEGYKGGGTVFSYEGPETAYSAEHGCPSVIGGPTPEQLGNNSNMAPVHLEMTDCHASLPENSTICGFDFSRIDTGKWDKIQATAANPATEPTHKYVFGIRYPESNNGNNIDIGWTRAIGLYAGIIHNVHVSAKYVNAFKCFLGVGVTGDSQYGPHDGHSSIVLYLTTEQCAHHIGGWSPTEGAISLPVETGARLLIGLWDVEDAAAALWYTTVDHLLDANNELHGDPRGTTFGRVGKGEDLKPLTVSGGANFPLRNIKLSLEGSGRLGEVIKITATNATWPIPAGVKTLEITCLGGGGGGGGGGSSSAIAGQAGGAGGGGGAFHTDVVSVGVNTTLNVTVGTGGNGGAGGEAGGHAGEKGTEGKESSVTGTGISVSAHNNTSGLGSASNSATVVGSILFGSNGQVTTISARAAEGGASAATGGTPFGLTGGGGGGGGTTSAAKGGGGGKAGTTAVGGTAGVVEGSGTTAGGEGESAAANTGAGGGGGGGGSWNGGSGSGAGGKGGKGGSGFVLVRIVG